MVEIPLATGGVALVDDCDADLLARSWWQNSRGYVIAGSPPATPMMRLHRVVMERALGRRLSSRLDVDHIDGDPLNNTRGNLRPATRQQNQANRSASKERRYKGVYRSQTPSPRWVAKITIDGKPRYLGSFATPEAAARAYNRACRQQHGAFARLNQVKDTP